MKLPMLNLGTYEGVTVTLVTDAWSALQEALMQKCTSAEVEPELMQRIAAGTMTFVEGAQWRSNDLYRVLHTGITTELEELGDLVVSVDEGFPFELVFSVPFISGLLPTHQRELEQGFGPKPLLFAELKRQVAELRPVG